ncbi:MAG: hypothetical protein RDU30_11310 [Desulfovibrionaceae bacterium]|nr:hypothetical protein [Desulfovibrionaceae bacterium]
MSVSHGLVGFMDGGTIRPTTEDAMIVRCEMCFSDIGSCDPGAVHAPLAGAMFGPLGPGFTPPFAPDAPFEAPLCPICGRRAMGYDMDRPEAFRRDRLLTPEGYFVAEAAAEKPLTRRPGGMDKTGKTGRIGHSGRPGRSAETRGAAHV